jgi:tetratricopeptide (TPR) repeat protein
VILPVALAAAAIAATAQFASDPEAKLEAAVNREIVLGDLKGAMEQYRAILMMPDTPKEVAARAWFEIGRCQEKLGQRREARATYARVVNEFGDQAEVARAAQTQIARSDDPLPGPQNLKFERGVTGKVPPGWIVPSLPKDADYLAELRRVGCRSGIGCAVVLVPANAPTPFANLMQSFSAAAYRGKTVRLRAWLKLEPAAAGDHAQMWLSVDRSNRQRGFFDNMDDRPIRSMDWTRCEISCPVDRDATFINFGVMSLGRGKVWVDDVSFEVVR